MENIRKKKFKELEINSNKQIKKYIFPRQILNSKYNLVTALFAMGKNKEAFVLLNTTKWGIYSKEVKAFKAFEYLYNSDIASARNIYNKIYKHNKKNCNIEILGFLLDLIDNNVYNNKLHKTIYPIVEEITKRYEK